MIEAIETQKNSLRKEKEAAELRSAERHKAERRYALRWLRLLQAKCKDLEEFIAADGDGDEMKEEILIDEAVMVRFESEVWLALQSATDHFLAD